MEKEIEICQECKKNDFRYDPARGEWCCLGCGLIVKDKELDLERSSGQKHEGPRYPVGVIAYGGKPGSYVDRKNLDSRGNKISPYTLSTMNRIRKWHYGLHSLGERRIIVAMSRLHFLLQQFNAKAPIKKEADMLLLNFLKKIDTRGRNFEHLAAAVIYVAYKIKGVPKSIDEISNITSINKKTINRYRRLLLNTLEIKIIPISLQKYIPEIAGKLDISRKSQNLANQLLKKAEENGFAIGRKPIGLVVAALYLACKQYGEKITQQSLAEAADVSEVTLRTRCRELKL